MYSRTYDDANMVDALRNWLKSENLIRDMEAIGVIRILPNGILHIKDKALDITWSKLQIRYLKTQYTVILSSPEVWNQILKT